jgi:hypothetical protein
MRQPRNFTTRESFSNVQVEDKPPLKRLARVEIGWNMDVVVNRWAGSGVELPAQEIASKEVSKGDMASLRVPWDIRNTSIDKHPH